MNWTVQVQKYMGGGELTVEEYFSRVTDREKKIEYQKDKIASMRSNLTNISVDITKERVKSSPDQDTMGRQHAAIEAQESILKTILEELDALKEQIKIDLSEALHNSVQELILFKHYCEHKRYNIIALELDYSEQHIYTLRRTAYKKLRDFLKDNSK